MEVFRLVIESKSPLLVGQEAATRMAAVDKRMFRVYEVSGGRLVERIAIPGSTIKGVFRHVFEDALRELVLSSISPCDLATVVSEALRALWDVSEIIDEKIWDVFVRRLSQASQLLPPEYVSSASLEGLYRDIRSSLGAIKDADKVARLASMSITELLPFLCDPLGELSCVPDTGFLEFGSDRQVTARLVINTVLLRKTPLKLETCASCLLFGAPGLASRLKFTNARASDDIKALPVTTRVALDRYTKASRKGKLFTLEYVPPSTRFESEVYFVPMLRVDNELKDRGLLREILSALARRVSLAPGLGACSTVGYGLVSISVEGGDPQADLDSALRKYLRFYLEKSRIDDTERVVSQLVMIIRRDGGQETESDKLRRALERIFEARSRVQEVVGSIC